MELKECKYMDIKQDEIHKEGNCHEEICWDPDLDITMIKCIPCGKIRFMTIGEQKTMLY